MKQNIFYKKTLKHQKKKKKKMDTKKIFPRRNKPKASYYSGKFRDKKKGETSYFTIWVGSSGVVQHSLLHHKQRQQKAAPYRSLLAKACHWREL